MGEAVSGVPQGSVMCPIVLNRCVNDYADDVKYIASVRQGNGL